jgi:hypothetical protein
MVKPNNNDLSPDPISPLSGAMELTTIQSQRQVSSSTSPAYGLRNILALKDSEIGFNIQNTFSEPQQIRQEIRNRKKVLQMSKG